MSGVRSDAGRRGEDLAAGYMEGQGYRILRRNYRCSLGELDLVAEGPEGLVFVEVRSRRSRSLVGPEESITRAKAHRLVRAAEHYLSSTGQGERPWRVDAVAVEIGDRGEVVRIERFRDAISHLVGP